MKSVFLACIACFLPSLSLGVQLSDARAETGFLGIKSTTCVAHTPLVPPSTEEYQLREPHRQDVSQWGQTLKLWDILLGRIDGLKSDGYKPFFVESGARDGEEHSNTLYLERFKHWTGLLVEPSVEYNNLLKKHRKSWSFNGALSATGKPGTLEFRDTRDGLSHVTGEKPSFIEVNATSLLSMLQCIQPPVNVIDFWSLDIEGFEGGVLETTDFKQIEVGSMMIENNKGGENSKRIFAAMKKQGFEFIGWTRYNEGFLDSVFVNPSYFKKRNLAVPSSFGSV